MSSVRGGDLSSRRAMPSSRCSFWRSVSSTVATISFCTVLFAGTSVKADFDVAGYVQQHYEDVCAVAPVAQEAATPGPLDAETMEEHGLEFVAMNVIYRHGSRTSKHAPTECFSGAFAESLTHFDCDVHSGFVLQWLNKSHPEGQEVMGDPPFVKTYHNGYLPSKQAEKRRCAPGQLVSAAADQLRTLAHGIKEKYFPSYTEVPHRNTTRMYSTDVDRTIASTYLLQAALFGNKISNEMVKLETRPLSEDAWSHNAPCDAAQEVLSSAEKVPEPEELGEPLRKKWKALFGREFSLKCHDQVVVANCTGHLPDTTLANGQSLLAQVVAANFIQEEAKYRRYREEWAMMVGPALLELQDFARSQADGSDNRSLGLWATHDTVIIPLLETLGVWDGRWPQYAEANILEIYKSTTPGSSKVWVRLLRRGKPLQVPSCKTQGPAGLCDLDELLPQNVVDLRDPVKRSARCTVVSAAATPTASSAAAASPNGVGHSSKASSKSAAWIQVYFFSFMLLYALGRLLSWQAWQWEGVLVDLDIHEAIGPPALRMKVLTPLALRLGMVSSSEPAKRRSWLRRRRLCRLQQAAVSARRCHGLSMPSVPSERAGCRRATSAKQETNTSLNISTTTTTTTRWDSR
eukprot:CAMPEP_0206455764 /NCGR_PEP_ID=MMETSP0324_2-20121206/21967_1 /ASSEMBLY_ACC=CAM_ASM_000836 /TAXON_ID=2866 /ORGANISM="Crypthecodinium cohnii, Strain Seligo" /LENGTH=631 /DNA_ID=CAMNT_0053926571 /DNA_START=119 /DNA_END=2012 /DNA_ORIENTATION=-